MPTSDQEIEETLRQSRELMAKSEALIKEALDPNKQLGPLFEAAAKEFERLGEVLVTKGAPEGTGIECFGATAELIGDFAGFEAVALEAMSGKGGAPSSAPPRPGMRRGGVRI